ncbi:glucan endo-1,3-beta-glucosidase 13 [Phalaenopsis equestris]|uniref:glucan endo-1,3-beta-glucosidase 13 n=1 Tax=Phalaenopsis equestris TaxID=78828 RepID=UPI0009E3721F|nr:glucan endo-1,3-beta-glucosidase 13 [Phalaenopsis equestris]
MAKGRRLLPLISLLSVSLLVEHCNGGKVGVCYGRNADDLPTPDKVAQLIQLHSIKYVRLYDANIQVLKAFANTGVELMIGIPNLDLLAISQYQSNADTWLKNNMLPYYPATMITYITVGAEITESPVNVSSLVVPAMTNVHTALKKVGLHQRIKVSSTHSLAVLSRSFPPSAGAFDSKFAFFLKPMLEFLVEIQSPFMIDLYPYYAYRDSSGNVSLDYSLFNPSKDVIDPNTGLVYTNMFDAQMDAIYFALMALNFRTLKVMVTESGWPNKGSAKEAAATSDNAQAYDTNLIRHVINDTGTPAKPGEEIDVYIFSLFNENRKPGLESERNWGLFYPDQTSIFSLDFTGKGSVDVVTGANITSLNGTWCVASANASEQDLKNALDWACGPGNVDCSAIQPSQPCFQPDSLASHASYAFNIFYQQNGATDIACSFGGAGIITTKDPSYDKCKYATSGKMNNTNSTGPSSIPSTAKSFAASCTIGCLFLSLLALHLILFELLGFMEMSL